MKQRSRDAGVRVLYGVTTLGLYLMVAVSALVVILIAVVLAGHGSVSVDSTIRPPYTIRFDDDRSVTVEADRGSVTYTNFDRGETGHFAAAPTVSAPMVIDTEDSDSRVVGAVGTMALLAIAWAGLINLHKIARSARDADPFDPSNVRRFRWLALIVVLAQIVVEVEEWVLSRTLDADVAVNVSLTELGRLPVIGVALALLALAEIFKSGSELRLFEQETV